MSYSEDDIRGRGQAIAALVMENSDDAAADTLGGYMMTQQAHRNPLIYTFAAEDFLAAGRPALVAAAWQLFLACIEEYAHDYREDQDGYAQAVAALSAFVNMLADHADVFAAYDVFSEKFEAAIDYFDEVTIGARPAERIRNDNLFLGDKAIEAGQYYAAAQFYKKAAMDNKPEGWLRLLQLMSEYDLGRDFDQSAAAEACTNAHNAGIWYAAPYYLQSLVSAGEKEKSVNMTDDLRAELSHYTQQFICNLYDYAEPQGQAAGFSKYLAPAVRQDSVVGIFSQQKPEDVVSRLEAAGRATAIKSAVGAFMTLAVMMLSQDWINDEDIVQLPEAMARFDALMAEESALIAETAAQSSSLDNGSFEAEQKVFHDLALGLNATIANIMADTRKFLQERV